MKCSNCGREISDESKYCKFCGAEQTTATEVVEEKPVKKEKRQLTIFGRIAFPLSIINVICLGLSIICLIICAIYSGSGSVNAALGGMCIASTYIFYVGEIFCSEAIIPLSILGIIFNSNDKSRHVSRLVLTVISLIITCIISGINIAVYVVKLNTY